MIPLRLFASRAFSAGNATNALFNGAMYGMLFFLPQYLQTAQHDGPFAAGVRLLPWTGALFAIAPLAGRLADRIGDRPLVAGGLFVQAAGTAWLAVAAARGGGYATLFAPLLLTGTGLAFAIPCTQRLVMNAVARADIGKASGTFTMLRYLGGVFGVAVLAAVFARYGAVSSAQTFAAGFAPAMWADAALASLAALTALAVPSRAAAAQAVAIPAEQAA
jgi:MFS family permease